MYDIAIIGAGPAGIAAAKLAVRNNLSVVLIEQDTQFGGICLNRGCIPTKFLSKNVTPSVSWTELLKSKDELIQKIQKPIKPFLEKLGIVVKHGQACFVKPDTLSVGSEEVTAKNIIIATGSIPIKLSKNTKVITSEELLDASVIGERILIVGAGYIGIEFASLLTRLGKKVTIVEKESSILPGFDSGLANRLKVVLERQGISIATNMPFEDSMLREYDTAVISVGRKANTDTLNLSIAEVTTDKGWVVTDEYMRTNIANIYACGDVTGKRMLAYTAEHQALISINNILGKPEKEDYLGLPQAVFSSPQLAYTGMTETEAKAKGFDYRVIKSNFLRFSAAHVYGDSDGFIQIIAAQDDTILGVGLISNLAAELISIFSLCIKHGITLSNLQKDFFIHPTLGEIILTLVREQ